MFNSILFRTSPVSDFTNGSPVIFSNSSMYLSETEVMSLYEKIYAKTPFVRIKKNVQLSEVIGSNFCDIALYSIHGKLIVQAVIDNMVKGAAGTAIHNMNIMSGFDETTGLTTMSPIFP